VFLLIYLPVIELEEQHLRHLFPRFEAYAQSVPALWPALHAAKSDGRFRWSLYVRNREYQALLGWLAGMTLLLAKVLVR
jgi:protein-S-isoprenylcysteine O-methyltransferase Ste14